MTRELTRRRLLEEGAALAATTSFAGMLASDALAKKRIPRRSNGRTVAVLGGGVAGLTAAHELIERGFDVHVFERKALGGKARSIPFAGSATGGRLPLPGEHGFRFFPGFYHHVPDTMRRIPFGKNSDGVWNNLIPAPDTKSPRTEGRADGTIFALAPDPNEMRTPDGFRRILTDALTGKGVPPQELAYFVERLMVFATSGEARRFGQWENVSWWDFIKAEGKSDEYKKIVARGLTRTVVAAKEKKASTRTIGHMGEAFVWNIVGQGNDGAPDRVLNAPTNEAWIDPWIVLLRSKGVRFHVGYAVDRLGVRDGRIASASATRRGRHHRIDADWFVSAMPVERARRLLSANVLYLDPRLEGMNELYVDWMNGIQYYLRKPLDIVHGHMTFADAPWALTGLTQGQFWGERSFKRDYGDGSVVDCLSVDISDWDSVGWIYGKPAKECTREEVAREVLTQIQAHLNDNGTDLLTDDMVHSWHLDPAIRWSRTHGRNQNDDPLLVNTIGSWERRPEAATAIPNFFLAGDYVRTDLDLATMEGANESAREAVNQLLHASGSKAEPARKYKLYRSPAFDAVWAEDDALYRAGQPNALDHV